MADYTGTCRSNYFRVNDEQKFKQWCTDRLIEYWINEGDAAITRFAISHEEGSWPSHDPETDAEIDFTNELAQHLHPTNAATLLAAGHERLRYVHGAAIAVHPDGRVIAFALSDIQDRAREAFGPDVEITEAHY